MKKFVAFIVICPIIIFVHNDLFFLIKPSVRTESCKCAFIAVLSYCLYLFAFLSRLMPNNTSAILRRYAKTGPPVYGPVYVCVSILYLISRSYISKRYYGLNDIDAIIIVRAP